MGGIHTSLRDLIDSRVLVVERGNKDGILTAVVDFKVDRACALRPSVIIFDRIDKIKVHLAGRRPSGLGAGR